MKRLRLRSRWAPVWFSIVIGVLYIPVAYGVVRAVQNPQAGGEGIRIFLPLFAIFTYWALAIAANSRTVIIKPSGVTVTLRPFPVGNGESIPRASVAHCYARHIVGSDDGGGGEIEDFYAMGVETRTGRQIDIHSPFDTAGDALFAARDIVQILNRSTADRPIDAHTAPRVHNDPAYKRLVLIWFALSMLAVLCGAIWEIRSGTL